MVEKIKVFLEDVTEFWSLSEKTFYYCPTHGKSRAILENGTHVEIIKTMGSKPLFFCRQCGMIKMIDVYSNSTNLCNACIVTEEYIKKSEDKIADR